MSSVIKSICLAAALLILPAVYALLLEPHSITVREYRLEQGKGLEQEQKQNAGRRSLRDDITVVQFSDTEISRFYTEKDLLKAAGLVNRQHPDIIVFTGDLFSNYARYHPKEEVISILDGMKAKYGKFAVWGNKEYIGGAQKQYLEIMEKAGFQVLQNEGVMLRTANQKEIFIGGLEEARFGRPDMGRTLQELSTAAKYSILLMHEPDSADQTGDFAVDLVLAGHSHGGQIYSPLFAEQIRRLVGYEGRYFNGFYRLHNRSGSLLYVNSGLGTSRIPVRIGVPPQIAVFHIQI